MSRTAFAVTGSVVSILGVLTVAPSAAGAVAFLEKGPLTLEGTPVAVDVFNGGRAQTTVRLRLTGKAGEDGLVQPAKLVLGRGQVGTFTVTTTNALPGELVAYASDGSLARRTIAPAKDEDAAPPASIDLAGTNRVPTPLGRWIEPQVDVPDQTFQGLSAEFPRAVVGYLSSDQGNVADVIREGNTVSVSEVDRAGEYTGKVQLSPGADPTDVTLRVRDAWGWALAVLVVGLLIAAISESWVSRRRPKRELETRIERLKERCQDLCSAATLDAKEHRSSTESLQRIYSNDGESLLGNEGDRLMEGLRNALSDEERKTWGPAGDKLKALEQQEDTYAELLRNSVEVATLYGDLERSLTGNKPEQAALANGPLTTAVDGLLIGGDLIKSAAELKEHRDAAEKLRGAVGPFAQVFRELARLQELASRKHLSELEGQVLYERGRLVRTYDADESEESRRGWDKKVDELRDAIDKQPKAMQPQPGFLQAAMERLRASEAPTENGQEMEPDLLTSSGDSPVALFLPPRRARYLKLKLSIADSAFALVTWPIVAGAGLALLYFKNPTFGLPGDYLGALVWGATGELALSLVRRLVPTTFGGLRLD